MGIKYAVADRIMQKWEDLGDAIEIVELVSAVSSIFASTKGCFWFSYGREQL